MLISSTDRSVFVCFPSQLVVSLRSSEPGASLICIVVLANTTGNRNSHVVSDCVYAPLLYRAFLWLTLPSFAASAVISIFALYFIYRRTLAVRKKVIIGMRDDLRSKNVPAADPTSPDFATADPDERSWKNPFAKKAVTAPGQAIGA